MSRFAVGDWKKQGLRQEGQDAAVLSPTDSFAKSNVENSDPDSIQALAAQLREAMARKGWSIGKTARQASQFLADGQRLGRPQVWHYMRGHARPRPAHLRALVQAFGRRSADAMDVKERRAMQDLADALVNDWLFQPGRREEVIRTLAQTEPPIGLPSSPQ